MKNKIKILGILILSVVIFSLADDVQRSKTINLNSLVTLNNANAEDNTESGGWHTCYDHEIGNRILAYECEGCNQKTCGMSLANRRQCKK